MIRLCTFTFLVFSSFAVIAFYFPLYFQHRGLTNSEIGLIMGLGSMISIIAQPFWGLVSDKRKTIKRVLALVLVMGITLSAPLFMSTTLTLIMLSMILFMFFMSSAGPLTESLIVKFAYENNRNYGSFRLWGEAGVGTAALLLGLAIERTGISYLGWMFVALVAVALLSMYWVDDAKAHSIPVTRESLVRLFSNRAFLLFLGLILLMSIPHRMNDVFLPIYISDLGASESRVGIAWMVATFCSVPTMAVAGWLLRKKSELFYIVLAGVFYAIRWIIYGLAPGPGTVIAAQALHMLTFPVMLVASVQFVYKIVPEELRATGQTTFTAVFFGLGGIAGSSGGGWIMDAFGAQALYFCGALMCVAGVVLTVFFSPYFSEKKKTEPLSA